MKIILLPCRFIYIKLVNKRHKILFSLLHAPDVYFRRGLLDPAFIYLAPAFYPSLVRNYNYTKWIISLIW